MLCKICKDKRANAAHVKTHGITYAEYLEKYEPEHMYKKRAVEALNDLYVTVRNRYYSLQFEGNAITVKQSDSNEQKNYGLTDREIIAHLDGRYTIGVYFPENTSKLLCFDIDTNDKEVLENIVDSLLNYVDESNILISSSGSKGFHVEVFFTRLINKKVLERFYKVVWADAGFPSGVESRGANNQALKLPLGFNTKHKKTDNYCYIANKYGISIDDGVRGYKLITEVEKVDPSVIYEAVEINYNPNDYISDKDIIDLSELKQETKLLPIYDQDANDRRETAEKLLKEGIQFTGKRHEATLLVAMYLKEKGYTKEKAYERLKKMVFETSDTSLYKTSFKEIHQEIESQLKTVYEKDYKIKRVVKDISLNLAEQKDILSVKKKHLRKLYFILLTHGKAFTDKQGQFYMTYDQMGQAGANSADRRHLKKQLQELESLHKITIVESNRYQEGKVKKAPNIYRVNLLDTTQDLIINTEVSCEKVCNTVSEKCFNCLMSRLMENKEMRNQISRRDKEELKKNKPVCYV